MDSCGDGRKRGDEKKYGPSKLPIMEFTFDRYCSYCRKKLPIRVLRTADRCPFCTRVLVSRAGVYGNIKEPNVWKERNFNHLVYRFRTPSGGTKYKILPAVHAKQKQGQEFHQQYSCSVEAAQQQQNRLNQRQLQLNRLRERQRRIQERLEQQRQRLENQRIRQREAALLREDHVVASNAICTLQVQNQDSEDDIDGPKY